MSEKKELVIIEEQTALELFSTKGAIDPLLDETKEFVRNFQHDLSTATGRKRTASLSARVSKLKVRLDNAGKTSVKEMKDQIKLVDSTRKNIRDTLDSLRDEARKPLTEWEEEQKIIEAEKAEKERVEKIKIQVDNDHEIAILLNEKFDREKKEQAAKEKAEQERLARIQEEERLAKIKAEEDVRIEREKRIAQEAKEKAEKEAKKREERAEKEKQDAIAREKKAQQEKIEAEERAKAQAKIAEERRQAETEEAERKRLADIEKAKREEQEKQRIAKEKAEREAKEREENEQNRKDKMNQAYNAFIEKGISHVDAVAIVSLISDGNIPNVKMIF